MYNNYYKKTIVLSIIFLFIGAVIIPSISGYTIQTINQSNKKINLGSPINNDYVNAYWKFDTGSGNTAYDSS